MYDAVVITNLPAFYKINLYQAIALKKRLFVIFVGKHSEIRTQDFNAQTIPFQHAFLSKSTYETRSTLPTLLALLKTLHKLKYKKIVLGGWDLPEYWLAWLLNPKRKLLLALESGLGESKITGIAATIKRIFLKRISGVLASGKPHQALLDALGYTGASWLTDGVGLMNPVPVLPRHATCQNRFLYLGRLSKEKNLDTLIQAVNQQQDATLTLVGNGPESEHLKALAGPNIHFQSHVPNWELNHVFQQHDVLILPSIREPWGLVVEEALFHGLPVLLSNTVGCRELVDRYQCGYLFDPYSQVDLLKQMQALCENFSTLQDNVIKIDFEQRQAHQVNQFEQALS
jgi:glycosyltransferase involved in cell wall biosynthesis